MTEVVRQLLSTKNMVKKNILLFFLVLQGCSISNDVTSGISKRLNEIDKQVGIIKIGKSSIKVIQGKFGGVIKKRTDNEGSKYNLLCLIVNDNKSLYQLNIMSGALGGWDIVTEYDLEKTKTKKVNGCGKYHLDKKPSRFIDQNRSYIQKAYGEPSKSTAKVLEYEFSYNETIDSVNPIKEFNVYSGIAFSLNNKGQIIKLNVFEVKSN